MVRRKIGREDGGKTYGNMRRELGWVDGGQDGGQCEGKIGGKDGGQDARGRFEGKIGGETGGTRGGSFTLDGRAPPAHYPAPLTGTSRQQTYPEPGAKKQQEYGRARVME